MKVVQYMMVAMSWDAGQRVLRVVPLWNERNALGLWSMVPLMGNRVRVVRGPRRKLENVVRQAGKRGYPLYGHW